MQILWDARRRVIANLCQRNCSGTSSTSKIPWELVGRWEVCQKNLHYFLLIHCWREVNFAAQTRVLDWLKTF
ncbi:hypothetical protein IFM89_023497 [Coptis chinensis]|uniref:Uncharacterized protein n=1 Tax=Coptis chinensis TaxID=261450 RepID=A0A835I516_9MAGN|nr:hypothetical protein IFM89_023497 [Coptis chinensis]